MIYYHFRSKDDLYQAVINEHMEQIANFLQRNIMEAGEYDNLFLRISEFLHALLKDRKEFMPIMLREIASGGERIKTALTSLISEKGITKSIREIIEAGINEGRFREIDSKQAIISFLGMNIFYLILGRFLRRNPVFSQDVQSSYQLMIDSVLNILTPMLNFLKSPI